ncbi:MAG: hypothetical protein LBT11_03040, partial [Treponema sp.]|nr:hypothetical protein [Treponema sp.]
LVGPAYNIVIKNNLEINLGLGLDMLATLCLYEANPAGMGPYSITKVSLTSDWAPTWALFLTSAA